MKGNAELGPCFPLPGGSGGHGQAAFFLKPGGRSLVVGYMNHHLFYINK